MMFLVSEVHPFADGNGRAARIMMNAELVAAGEVVIRLGGELIDDAALAALQPPYSSVMLDEGVHLLIDPAHPVRYGNHGCDPNLWHEDAVTITARRDIPAGEELTIDYATHTGVEGWSMACHCGRPDCRGRVTGARWRDSRPSPRWSWPGWDCCFPAKV